MSAYFSKEQYLEFRDIQRDTGALVGGLEARRLFDGRERKVQELKLYVALCWADVVTGWLDEQVLPYGEYIYFIAPICYRAELLKECAVDIPRADAVECEIGPLQVNVIKIYVCKRSLVGRVLRTNPGEKMIPLYSGVTASLPSF